MSPRGFGQVVSIIESAYRLELTQAQRDVWFTLLRDADDAAVKRAAVQWCGQEHFPPVPADLLQVPVSDRAVPTVAQTRAMLSAPAVSTREMSLTQWAASLSPEEREQLASIMPALSQTVSNV